MLVSGPVGQYLIKFDIKIENSVVQLLFRIFFIISFVRIYKFVLCETPRKILLSHLLSNQRTSAN